MNCALELLGIQAIAEENHRLKEAELDAITLMNFKKIAQETIAFCDGELNNHLIKCAKERKEIRFRKVGIVKTDRLGNKIFYPLKRDSVKYANGEYSYIVSETPLFALDVLEQILQKHCFDIKICEACFKTYGLGKMFASEINIFIKK